MLTTRPETLFCLPQREPFIAVHEILSVSADQAETQFKIEAGSVFEVSGVISEAGLLENMAQSAAAQMGYECRRQNLPVPVGYLASVKNWIIHFLPLAGSYLTTSVVVTNRVMDVVLLNSVVRCDGKEACRCEMRIFIKSAS